MIFEEFLTKTFLKNTILQWLVALGLIVGTMLASRLIYFLFEKVFSFFTKKTATNLDDILLDSLRGPVMFAVFLVAFFMAFKLLFFPEKLLDIFSKVLGVLIIVNITWFATRLTTALIQNYISPVAHKKASDRTKTAFPLIKKIIIITMWVISLAFILNFLGVNPSGIVAGMGIGGLAIAFAAQDVLGNFFSGGAIIASKPFVVGDRIKVEGYDGFVKEISLRTTTLLTFDGTEVIIPNSKVANSNLENITREPRRRIKQVLTLEYSTSLAKIEKAKKILKKIIKNNNSTSDDSLVHFTEFDSSSINLQLIYWIEDLDLILQAKDEVNTEIKKQFEKEKIGFAYPSQTIYVKK
jgi:MscS family membrane protein